jgi:hypothetical protein
MSVQKLTLPILIGVSLSGCGTYVPEIQEFPGNAANGQQLVEAIVYNIRCEIQDAIDSVYNNKDHPVQSTYLDTWGAQITLTLQVEEKGGLTPVVNWLPPSPPTAIFNLAVGGTLSADATRIDKINSYYTVQELRKLGPCASDTRPGGELLLQSDLKLNEWLYDSLTAGHTGEINYAIDTSTGPFKQNVISHEVKFEILSSGNITPGWKLKTVSINQSGTAISASRDRTNDLIITFGPAVAATVQKSVNGKKIRTTTTGPSEQAAYSHLASDIGLAVANGIRSALQQQLP